MPHRDSRRGYHRHVRTTDGQRERHPRRHREVKVGNRVTLRPARVDPNMQANARRLAAAGYRRGTNWIAGRGKPVARRGDVPLDVIVAAADT